MTDGLITTDPALIGEREAAAVRDGMPRSLALTYLTGRPHTGQRGPRLRPGHHVVAGFVSMFGGLVLSCWALAGLLDGVWWFAPVLVAGWAVSLHGMRNLRMMVYHQAAHRNLWARPSLDRPLGRVIAGLLMVQDFERYSAEHVADHHAVHHMTVRDPTVQAFLIGLRLSPGMSPRQMWARVLWTLVNPVFHARFLIGRIRSYFQPAAPLTRYATAGAYLAVAVALVWTGWWPFALVCWVWPLTVPYQVSNTLRLCVKHTFPSPAMTRRKGSDYFGGLTNAIFIGEAAPGPGHGLAHIGRWARWWARMLLLHFPSRYLVLTGDTVCHDFHHRRPMSREWAGYVFERQADADAGHPGWPPYRAVWGLVPAIGVVFASLSAADPAEYHVDRIAAISGRDLFSAFDD